MDLVKNGMVRNYVSVKNVMAMGLSKIKLVIVNRSLGQPIRFDLNYTQTSGRIEHWVYSTQESGKHIETDFACALL